MAGDRVNSVLKTKEVRPSEHTLRQIDELSVDEVLSEELSVESDGLALDAVEAEFFARSALIELEAETFDDLEPTAALPKGRGWFRLRK